MTGREIYGKLNEIAPFAYAADWDHSGVQVGSLDRTVHRIMLALDPTEDVIRQAVDAGVDLLITHHPLLFGGVRWDAKSSVCWKTGSAASECTPMRMPRCWRRMP